MIFKNNSNRLHIFRLVLLLLMCFVFFTQCKKEKEPEITVQNLQLGILYDNEGNVYRTVVIGEQEWMAQNLNTANHTYGSSWCANNDPANCSKYGRLYTWDAIMNGEPESTATISTVRGICPAGWHVPNDYEWKQLEIFIGIPQSESEIEGWRGTDEGKKLKSKTGWAEHHLHGDGNGTDEFGFTALPGGFMALPGGSSFVQIGKVGNWWTSTQSANYRFTRVLSYENDKIRRLRVEPDKGVSLRCVKNKPF